MLASAVAAGSFVLGLLSQLAFAKEARILDSRDRLADYVERVLPQKVLLDRFYASNRSIGMSS